MHRPMTMLRPVKYRRKSEPALKESAAKRVLLVEDSSATTDLVTLVLTQAGHSVQAAGDGMSALVMLGEQKFDVVLTDFHLPDISGIEVVRRYWDTAKTENFPSFVAITGDVRGLLSDSANCEVFDKVVSKPLDIDAVCALVEQPIKSTKRSTPHVDVKRNPIAELPYAFLHWPSNDMPSAAAENYDAILIHAADDLNALWRMTGAHLLPVVDLTGKLGKSADFDARTVIFKQEEELETLISGFHDRRAKLHRDFIQTDDLAERLLSRAFVANNDIVPRRDATSPSFMTWNTLAPAEKIDNALSRLGKLGFVALEFFEKLHSCPGCESSRLMVREECGSCGSADLIEESYLHHFRCAYQGRESEFAAGDDLVCPKCRRVLSHFGADYDRPGLFVVCNSCKQSTSEPNVAFVCGDCDRHTPSDLTPIRTVCAGSVTDRGRAYLAAGKAALGDEASGFRFSDLPFDLVVKLNQAVNEFNRTGTPFSLCRYAFKDLFDLRLSYGARQLEDAKRIWFERFRQELGPSATCCVGSYDVFALLPAAHPAQAKTLLEKASNTADHTVRLEMRKELQIFGAKDLPG